MCGYDGVGAGGEGCGAGGGWAAVGECRGWSGGRGDGVGRVGGDECPDQ